MCIVRFIPRSKIIFRNWLDCKIEMKKSRKCGLMFLKIFGINVREKIARFGIALI